jgi:hypothetical protein
MLITLWPTIALLLASAIVLAFAWRGRRIDDHPICRGCGFDLFGLPKGAGKCSECGSDLNSHSAIRIGHRQRRSALVLLSMMVCLGSVGWLSLIGWSVANGVAWVTHEPLWLLRRECSSERPATRVPAVAEILRRLGNKTISAAEIRPVIDDLLSLQSNRRLWYAGWGDVIEASHDLGLTTVGQWDFYLQHGAVLGIESRSAMRAGDPIPVRLVARDWRFGTRQRMSVQAKASVHIGEVPPSEQRSRVVSESHKALGAVDEVLKREISASSKAAFMFRGFTPDTKGWTVELTDAGWNRLKVPSLVPIKVVVDATTTDVSSTAFTSSQWKAEVVGQVMVYTADVEYIPMIPDPGIRPQMQSAIHVDRVSASGMTGPQNVAVFLSAGWTPAPASFDVWLRTQGREFCIGRFATQGAERNVVDQILDVTLPADIRPMESIDVILRSNPRAAASTLDQFRGWEGELQYPGIRVQWSGGAQKFPATWPSEILRFF